MKQEDEMGWKPIETAPKDGTEIIILIDCASQWVVHIARYNSYEKWEESGKYTGFAESLEEWEG